MAAAQRQGLRDVERSDWRPKGLAFVLGLGALALIFSAQSQQPNVSSVLLQLAGFGRHSPLALTPVAYTFATDGAADSAVIFLHGAYARSEGFGHWVETAFGFRFPRTEVVYPQAPEREYTLTGGTSERVWFDRTSLTPGASEKPMVMDIAKVTDEIKAIIAKEVSRGIPLNRIVLGGFSQGAAMALQAGLGDEELAQNLAGVFAMSAFLAEDSALPRKVEYFRTQGMRVPPVLQLHGDSDPRVRLQWAENSAYRFARDVFLFLKSQRDSLQTLAHHYRYPRIPQS